MVALSFANLYLSSGGSVDRLQAAAENIENISQVFREGNREVSELAEKVLSQIYGEDEIEAEDKKDNEVSTTN